MAMAYERDLDERIETIGERFRRPMGEPVTRIQGRVEPVEPALTPPTIGWTDGTVRKRPSLYDIASVPVGPTPDGTVTAAGGWSPPGLLEIPSMQMRRGGVRFDDSTRTYRSRPGLGRARIETWTWAVVMAGFALSFLALALVVLDESGWTMVAVTALASSAPMYWAAMKFELARTKVARYRQE